MRARQARAPAGPGPIQADPAPAATATAAAGPRPDSVRRALGNQAVQRLAVQAKLAVGRSTDPLEREADRVADVVVRRSAPAAAGDDAGSCPCHGGGGTGPAGSVWRCRAARGAGEHAGLPVAPGVQASLEATRGAGRPLPGSTRSFFERRFDHDFGDVRVHTDAAAADLSARLGARAFTWGRDVYFGAGRFDPGSPGGRWLVAHELTHTLQQRQAGPRPALLQRDDTETEAEEETEAGAPAALLSVALTGLRFTPFKGATYRPGPKLPQAVNMAVRRLVGEAWRPGMAEQFLAYVHAQGVQEEHSPELDGDAQGGEEMLGFVLYGSIPFHLMTWIDNGGAGAGVKPQLTDAQRDLVVLGLGARRLLETLDAVASAEEIGLKLPAWYSSDIFYAQVAARAGLLRVFMTAYERYDLEPSEENWADVVVFAADMVASLREGGALVLEAVRQDEHLVGEEAYQLIWPPPEVAAARARGEVPPRRTRMAAETDPIDTKVASWFLSYLCTQPAVTRDAIDDRGQRRVLLKRFVNYLVRTIGIEGPGDQVISEEPGRLASDEPHPANMTTHPELEAPFFDAALRTDHAFTMHIQFPSVFDAFATYSYRFDQIRIPDDQVIGKAKAKAGRQKVVSVEDLPEGERPSWWGIYKSRMARDSRYLAEDVRTVWEDLERQWGMPGGTVALAAVGGLLRYIGSSIVTIFEILTEPEYQAHFEFPSEGLYVVRCRAVPRNPDEAEVTRPPSVAYVPVFAVDPAVMAERRVYQATTSEEASRRRLRELDEELADPSVAGEEQARLQEERRGLEASLGTVDKALAFQRATLQRALEQLEAVILNGADRNSETGQTLLRLGPRAREARRLRKQIEEIDEVLKLRKRRGLETTERVTAVFVSDRGAVVRLLLEAVNRTPAGQQSPQTWYVSDVTTRDSGDEIFTAGSRAEAIIGAIKRVLEGPLGYGRGHVSILLDGATHSRRIKASSDKLLIEALENVATIAAIAAIAAAPFTGGASLALLIPIGVIGAIPSAYRIATRLEAGTFRWDLQMAMDVVNIASSAIGLGQVAAGTRAIQLGRALMITGFGADGMGMVLMGADLVAQLEALEELPAGQREARRLEIIGGALLNAGVMIGGSLASGAHLRRVEAAAARGEGTYPEWRRGLDPESRSLLEANPGLRETYTRMSPELRALLTLCASTCIVPDATPAQATQLQRLIDDLELTPATDRWHWLRAWLHRNRSDLDAAIEELKGIKEKGELDQFLRGRPGLDAVEVVLHPYSDQPGGLRADPEARKRAQALLKSGYLTLTQLATIMANTKQHDTTRFPKTGGGNMLEYLVALTTHRPKGYERVVAELMQGDNWFTGAEWVLRYTHRANLWEYVEEFEVASEPGGRRWDARLATMNIQFKSWRIFLEEVFLRQLQLDYIKTAGFTLRPVRWVFEPRVGTEAFVRERARKSLEAARGTREGFTDELVDACLAELDRMIIVPAPF